MRQLTAFAVLTADLVRRLLREGIILRSLVFPVALTIASIMGTVGVVLWLQPPQRVALTPSAATPELVAALEADDWTWVVTDAPKAEIDAGTAAVATHGQTLWIGAGGHPPLPLEGIVRQHLGTRWRPVQPAARRAADIRESDAPRGLAVFIGALFSLYGVVFGAGGVARDRDEGTLDAELSTAMPHRLHGLARWVAGTTVLGGFYALSIALLHALMGLVDPVDLALEGVAACAASNAIGLLVIGKAGLGQGFAGPMSVGLVAVFTVLSTGFANPEWGGHLPIASMVVRSGPTLTPLLLAGALGLIAAEAFARRTAVS